MPRWPALMTLLMLEACSERGVPPGAQAEPIGSVVVESSVSSKARGEVRDSLRGTRDDDLPFAPGGTKLASIAWRTWVYTDTGPKRTRYGYLRAGAVVDARGPAIKNEGCAGGWYRINPRGFVCIGKGATLDLGHPVVTAASVRALRGQGLPYLYALSSEIAPLLYFRLPTAAEAETAEGKGLEPHLVRWRRLQEVRGVSALLGEPGAPPDFLAERQTVNKPYGVERRLHFSVHAGRASPDSGFAIQRIFDWNGRTFALTTEHDIIPLDRTQVVKPSEVQGVELAKDEPLPVAFAIQYVTQRYKLNAAGEPSSDGLFRYREGLKLTGRVLPGGFYETRDGYWVVGSATRLIAPRDSFPSFATGSRKWIDISIRNQTLVAYEGKRPVYAALISSGRGGLGDPEKHQATIRGTFMVHAKHVSSTMDGDDDKSDSFNLRDVPFVQYFHRGFALHGTYWHDEFGKVRSHGCVNLSPVDSAWLFEWTDPIVPPGWHAVINKERGTVVYIHI